MNKNYQDYLASPYWQSRRVRALDLAGRKCQQCDNFSSLEVHHLSYENIGNEKDEDLIVLCSRCHAFERNLVNIYIKKKLKDLGFIKGSEDWRDYEVAKQIIPDDYNKEQYEDAIRSICYYFGL